MISPYKGKFWVTQGFKGSSHKGIDMVGSTSKDIYGTEGGIIVAVANDTGTYGWGKYTVVKGAQSNLYHIFAHLSVQSVGVGQTINKGDKIGVEGYTGYCLPAGPGGSHCHYEIRRDLNNRESYVDVSQQMGLPNTYGLYEYNPAPTPSPVPPTPPVPTPNAGFVVGEKVRVSVKVDYTGRSLGTDDNPYEVMQVSGDRIVVGRNGAVTAAINAVNLVKIGGGGSAQPFRQGDSVTIINPINYDNGARLGTDLGVYQVLYEPVGNRVIIGRGNVITTAIHSANIRKI